VEAGLSAHLDKVLHHAERQSGTATVDFCFITEPREPGGMLKVGAIDPAESEVKAAPAKPC
jgi:hypothetical protein